jgi:hypothetical protein
MAISRFRFHRRRSSLGAIALQRVQLESRSKEKIQHQVGLPLGEDFLEDSVEHVLDVISCHNLSLLSLTCPH